MWDIKPKVIVSVHSEQTSTVRKAMFFLSVIVDGKSLRLIYIFIL
jgi:hypothetical protein